MRVALMVAQHISGHSALGLFLLFHQQLSMPVVVVVVVVVARQVRLA